MLFYLSIILIVFGVVSFIFQIFKAKKWAGIKHYEKIRDELTLRDDIDNEELEEDNLDIDHTRFPIGNIIGSFIILIVGINLIPTVMDLVNSSQSINSTIIGPSSTMLGMIQVLFVFAIVSTSITILMGFLRRSGIIEDTKKINKATEHYKKIRDKLTKR